MKRISHLLLLSIFLASCGNAVTPTPNVTVTRFAKVTVTYTPNPSKTPEATITPDPMADAPAGASGSEKVDGKTVFYKLGADGKTHNYDSGIKDPEGNVIWVSNHIKGSEYIPMLPGGGSVEEGFPMQFFAKDGLTVDFIEHTPGTGMKPGGYMGSIEMVLQQRYMREHPGISRQDFWNDVWPGQYNVTVTDVEGNVHAITSDTAFKIIFVDPNDIANPDFQLPRPTPSIFSASIFDDDANIITILVANTKPINQLSDEEFMQTLLYQLGHIMVFDDLSMEAWWADSGKAMQAGRFFNMARKDGYITLSATP